MILDYIENIEISPKSKKLQNFHSISYLKEGILMSYEAMKELEQNYFNLSYPEASPEEIEKHKNGTILSINIELNPIDAKAVNLFHWYSINLINYVKCCGLIQFMNKNSVLLPEHLYGNKTLIRELKAAQGIYRNSIPELDPVIHFRDKVSAHIAFADPFANDTPATLLDSMAIIPTYLNGKLTLGAWKRQRGEHISSFAEFEWSLTDNFESLKSRFFENEIDLLSFI